MQFYMPEMMLFLKNKSIEETCSNHNAAVIVYLS